MRRFAIVEHTHEFPFCSQLMAGFDRPWVLWVAALFHDIAKGRGGDHSKLGTVDARRFCKQHGISREDTDLIAWLVEHHLTMSHVAQKQDLTDPDVVKAFAQVVGNGRYLTALYLLTVADIRGTSPKVWNAWKGKLLEDLYRITLRVLGGARLDTHSLWAQKRDDTIAQLRLKAFDPELAKPLWDKLDMSFFMRHDARDIAWLTRSLFNKVNSPNPVVKARISPAGEGLQVAVYVKDQPDLFARICGYFERKAFSIQDAKIETTRDGYALDTFQITDPGLAGDYRDILTLVEHELGERVRLECPLPDPTQGRLSRQSRSFPSSRAWTCVPTSAASITCCRYPPTTAPACCTRSRACWPNIACPCIRHASIRSVNAWKTCSWSTARDWPPTTDCRFSLNRTCSTRWPSKAGTPVVETI
jgi:[protein-PII] uridylyltransferase